MASAGFGFKYLERFASVPYFGRALAAENIPDAELAIRKALALNNNDLYMRTYAQLYLIKFFCFAKHSLELKPKKSYFKKNYILLINQIQ